jgi:hypothetical protein
VFSVAALKLSLSTKGQPVAAMVMVVFHLDGVVYDLAAMRGVNLEAGGLE